MNLEEAIKKACQEATLKKALSWIAIWETERVVRQAKKYFETGVSTASHGGGWDTCFEVLFGMVLDRYKPRGLRRKMGPVLAIDEGAPGVTREI
jgi:hypothetical protein